MKTREEILQGKYVIDNFVFDECTPKDLAQTIINLIGMDKRIVLDYGDVKTKESWGEVYDVSGYIGYSRGAYDLKYPILVHNKRSMGGGTILTHCILSICLSSGSKSVIYSL